MMYLIRSGMIWIFCSVLGYSFLPVFIKNLLGSGLVPLEIGVWRYALALPFFWILARLWRTDQPKTVLPRLPVPRLMLLGVLLAVAALCAFFGLQYLPAGAYVVIFYTYPAMVALMGLMIGDRLPLTGWVALGLSLVAVMLTAPDFAAGLRGENLLGVGLALLNAFVVAVYFIFNSRLLKGQPSVMVGTAWIVTGCTVALLLTVPINGLSIPQGTAWLHLIGLALVSTVFPVVCLSNGIRRLGAARASIIGSFEPLLTAVIAFIFIGERMQDIQWLGGVVMVASVILLQWRRGERQAPAPVVETVSEASA